MSLKKERQIQKYAKTDARHAKEKAKRAGVEAVGFDRHILTVGTKNVDSVAA